MPAHRPYGGAPKLVLGIDIGTTYSGVSYAILEPGEVPEIRSVTRFPAQEHVGGDSKIPSIVIYDEAGVVRAVGAEARQEKIIDEAEDKAWLKIEWFKLHLRPKGLDSRHMKALTLPPNISVVRVYADFLRYLIQCTRKYIEETHVNGEAIWKSLKDSIAYVITHPNGWEGPQQANIRRAAVEASLITDTPQGHNSVQFLTEGEASLYFCIQNGLTSAIAQSGEGVIVVDAGGGTIDISAFAAAQKPRNSFEEISAAQCYFQGSFFVTHRAQDYLTGRFKDTKFRDDVQTMTQVFDRTTKLRFRSADEPSYIKFGGIRDKDPALNIRAGQLTLEGSVVCKFFNPSIDSIVRAVSMQRQNSHKPISLVFLVGGFAASDYLYTTLQSQLHPLSLSVSRPDSHVNKAVADGAVAFYVKRLVTTRVARFFYGTEASVEFDPSNREHQKRRHLASRCAKGVLWIPGEFSIILSKGTKVSESQVFSKPYVYTADKYSALDEMVESIIIYRGNVSHCPKWTNIDAGKFSEFCKVKGNLRDVKKPIQRGPNGSIYYQVRCMINIVFGPAEINAYLSWEENGATKTGPVELIYNMNGH